MRCAARGTEMYSGKPAASIVVRNSLQKMVWKSRQGSAAWMLPVCRLWTLRLNKWRYWWMNFLAKKWNRQMGFW